MTAPKTNPKTVLVVDDESDVLQVVTRILEFHSFQVLSAASPQEAIRLGAEYEGEIDVLLSDVLMQEMPGHLLAAKLTRLRPQMRVILMSGYADGKLRMKAGWHFIQKPFVPSALVSRVKNALGSAV